MPGSGMAVSVEMSESLPSLALINLSAKQQSSSSPSRWSSAPTSLWEVGAKVRAYDPEAMDEARRHYPDEIANETLILTETEEDALDAKDIAEIEALLKELKS